MIQHGQRGTLVRFQLLLLLLLLLVLMILNHSLDSTIGLEVRKGSLDLFFA